MPPLQLDSESSVRRSSEVSRGQKRALHMPGILGAEVQRASVSERTVTQIASRKRTGSLRLLRSVHTAESGLQPQSRTHTARGGTLSQCEKSTWRGQLALVRAAASSALHARAAHCRCSVSVRNESAVASAP